MADGRLRLVYAGALTPTYDLGLAIRALRLVVDRRPELQPTLELYGRGDAEMGLREAAAALGLSQAVRFHGRVPVEAIPAAIAAADIGLATVEPSRFTALSLSTKIFEYGAMRRAVVAARLALAERLFGPDRIWLYEPGDAEGLAAAIVDVVDAGPRRDARIEAMAARVGELAWDREGPRYVELIEALAAGVGVPHRA
jgi:glycosyltransferase involved in cell wall biosynthesis